MKLGKKERLFVCKREIKNTQIQIMKKTSREHAIFFYLKKEEKERIKEVCKELHISVSAFCRSNILRIVRQEQLLLKPTKSVEVEEYE